ncbi:TPA: hypothetical protein I7142_18380 [Vibrio vulnificus]|nr:hypothetical protein [Vibrio vulnificus]HAS6035809.1 hypothetical protein [Vibrio vulnificus]
MFNLCNNDISELTSLAHKAIEAGIAGNDDLRRVVFDVYATLCYQGFYSEELLGYHEVLDNIPKQYLPCDDSQVSTFFITHVTIDRTVKRYKDFLFSEACKRPSFAKVISDIFDELPMTTCQINKRLVNGGFCQNAISSRAISNLFNEVFLKEGCSKSVLLFKSSKSLKDDGTRYERNSRPSFTAFCYSGKDKELKSLSTVLVRAAEIIGKIIGFVDHSHLIDLVDSLHKEKVNSLFDDWSKYREYVISVLSEKYGPNYSGRFAIADYLEQSELYRWLYQYMYIRHQISKKQLSLFVSKVLDYKLAINFSSKKDKVKDQVSVSGIYATFDRSYVSPDVIESLIENIDFLYSDGDTVFFDSSIVFDYDDNHSVAVQVGIDFLVSGGAFTKSEDVSSVVNRLLCNYSDAFNLELRNALLNPDGMFQLKDNLYFVDAKSIAVSDNRRGKYYRAEYLELSEELFHLEQELQDVLTAKREGFKSMMDSFHRTYNSKVNNLPDIISDKNHKNHLAYMQERDAILAYGDFESSQMYLMNEIRRCEKQMRSLSKYEAHLESIDGIDGSDYSTSLKNVRERFNRWLSVRNADLSKIEQLKTTPNNLLISDMRIAIQSLKSRCSKLRIRHNQYKSHLLIHDFIVPTTSKPKYEVERFVENYCSMLKNNTLVYDDDTVDIKQFDGVYHNMKRLLTVFVESHPFAIPTLD